MSSPRSAVALIRSLDLLPDGPSSGARPCPAGPPASSWWRCRPGLDEAPIDIVAVRDWLERVPGLRLDGERPTADAAGRAPGLVLAAPADRGLRRAHQQVAGRPRRRRCSHTPLGDRKPHPGGHWLWTLADRGQAARLVGRDRRARGVRGRPGRAPSPRTSIADGGRRLAGFGPILPWANLTSATGDAKRTGITAPSWPRARRPASARQRRARGDAKPPRNAGRAARTRHDDARARAARATRAVRPQPRCRPTMVTAAGLAALQAELEELTTVKRPEVILRVKSARELGDLRENADYEAARNEQSFLEGRIRDLEQMIKTAVVIQTVGHVEHLRSARGSMVDAEGAAGHAAHRGLRRGRPGQGPHLRRVTRGQGAAGPPGRRRGRHPDARQRHPLPGREVDACDPRRLRVHRWCSRANASGACKLVGDAYPFEPGDRLLLAADDHNSVNGIRESARARGAEVQLPATAAERPAARRRPRARRSRAAPTDGRGCSPTRHSRTTRGSATRSAGSTARATWLGCPAGRRGVPAHDAPRP